ncbi:hypothetical protein ACIRBX_04320 [Kitasatospora sp. NPDC096147]|uniref:hypothetical protein n=1 Tax=Kitasatospora sp. NPDC096147 TaxID=3364093 RepID=UPI0038165744
MGIFSRKRRERPTGSPQDAAVQEAAPQDAVPQDAGPGDAGPRGSMRPVGPQDPPMPAEGREGTWIYEVSGEYSSETWAPPEAIVRWWQVDADGNVVGEAVENENFGPPKDDLARITDPDGPLRWLPDPERSVRAWLDIALGRIAEGLEVHWLKVTKPPLVLGGRDASDFTSDHDFDQPPPPRIGVAVPVGFGAQLPGYSKVVMWGLVLWVLVDDGSGEDPVQNVWYRHEIDAERAEESLRIALQAPDIRF